MKKATLTLGAGLILLTGWLLVPSIASAQALKTPIEGSWTNCAVLGTPEREWVDEDGIRHVRGWRYFCRHDGAVEGREEGVLDGDIDRVNGNGVFERGSGSFSGTILGEPASATGHYTLECTIPPVRLTCSEEHVWHLEDGRLLKFSATYIGTRFPKPYTGILLDPPGLGPVKRNRPRSR
jgi:hypothetical protein